MNWENYPFIFFDKMDFFYLIYYLSLSFLLYLFGDYAKAVGFQSSTQGSMNRGHNICENLKLLVSKNVELKNRVRIAGTL